MPGKRRLPWVFLTVAVPALSLLLAGITLFLSTRVPLSEASLKPRIISSFRIADRQGRVIREVISDEEAPSEWVPLKELPPSIIWATLAAEDKRYFSHPGLDAFAILRAATDNVWHRRIVSGASTVSQQVIRNIYHFRRSWKYKVIEAWYAMRLEHTLGKHEILEQYLNRVPYGNRTYGVEAAARLYFGKRASRLSLAEAAFLAAIPRSPALYDPYRNGGMTKSRQEAILKEMVRGRFLSAAEYERSRREKIRLLPARIAFRAPHFSDFVLERIPKDLYGKIAVVKTTLDLEIQEVAEKLMRSHLQSLKENNVTNAAVLILDSGSGEILAMAGSADYFNRSIDGQVNGVLAIRSPGSSLKPFTYALALERGMTPASVLPDIETHLLVPGGDFSAKNYDEKYHGPVRLRTALASSYNIPAVLAQQSTGTGQLLERLHRAGFKSLRRDPDYYGPALTLGNGDVTLLELTRGYRAFAQGGVLTGEKFLLEIVDPMGNRISPHEPAASLGSAGDQSRSGRARIFSPQVSYLIARILSDDMARLPAFGDGSSLELPFPCAAKTGTSRDFRDNWTIGFTPRYTVGVWVGNFDASPMHQISGVTGAAPLFHDLMMELVGKKPPEEFERPPGIVEREICSLSGKIPGPYCHGTMVELFVRGTEPGVVCDYHQPAGTVYPPEYRSWAEASHLEEAPLQGERSLGGGLQALVSGGSTRPDSDRLLAVQFPLEGNVFKLDPVLPPESQKLLFKGRIPARAQKVTWILDGKPLPKQDSPFHLYWPVRRGIHTLQISATSERKRILSDVVTFQVLE